MMLIVNGNLSGDGRVASAAALRALQPPSSPPPGPLDVVVGLLLARAAPFDAATQAALRLQQGWGTRPPTDIPEVRTHGRWQATPALRRLTSTGPPRALSQALQLLEHCAPVYGGQAAALLLEEGLTGEVMHPGGVLTLARWYGVSHGLRLERQADGTTMVVGPSTQASTAAVRRLVASLGRAGYADLETVSQGEGVLRRHLDRDLRRRPGVFVDGDLVLSVDDQTSGLAAHVVRMLTSSPRPLTLDEVHEGLTRAWRFRRYRLVRLELLEAWVAAQPWIRRDGVCLTVSRRLPGRLSGLAAGGGTTAVLPLVRRGRLASWRQILAALEVSGMRAEAAKMAAHSSVILVHAGHDEYRLRGGTPREGALTEPDGDLSDVEGSARPSGRMRGR